MRLDQWLVENKNIESKAKAQALVKSGAVLLKESDKHTQEFRKIIKPGYDITAPDTLEVKIENQEALKYVSRAGLKLEGALKHLSLDVSGWTALDMGQSTGGFSDCLLQNGIEKVYGIDVGHDQLHESVKTNKNVVWFEGVNGKDPASVKEMPNMDLAVMDVSFISMTAMLPTIHLALGPEGKLLSLVKPQFELSSDRLSKSGLVKDDSDFQKVENKVRQSLEEHAFEVLDFFKSVIEGGDGNTEFFVFAAKKD